MSRNEKIWNRETQAIGNVMKIRFYPFIPASANGVNICDPDGKLYLDFSASGSVAILGYGHPEVREAILSELDNSWTTMHCCYPGERAIELAERLITLFPGDFHKKAWFGTTGSDANDCIYKLVPRAAGRLRLISYVGAYHGQTAGSSALSGHSAQSKSIGSGNVTKVPYPYCYRCPWEENNSDDCSLQCLNFLEEYALSTISPAEDTAAIIMEPIQSDGGEIVAPIRYIQALKEICNQHGIWLFFDEVKTGLGRTGKFFAFEHFNIEADGVSMAKPLGGGLPLSTVVTHQEILDVDLFNLYTLGGSPVPCAAALATLDVIDRDGLIDRAEQLGRYLIESLTRLRESHELIGDIRGQGLMAGIELVKDRESKVPANKETARLVYRCYELGLLVIYSGLLGNVIEITPPLIINEAQIDKGVEILDRALSDIETGQFDDTKLERFAGW